MTKQIVTIFLLFLAALNVSADPRWKMHTTFDGEIDYIFETPEYVYFTSRAMPDMNEERRMSLFRYDKDGDELQALSTDNLLSSNTISMAQYNPHKGYVVVLGNNYDLTFIYDDGKVVTMPDYRLANINNGKKVNSITIDPWHDRIYLATDFGYLAVNDEKYEISESRDYNESLKAVARVGDYIVLLKTINIHYAKSMSPRLSLSDYETRVFDTPFYISPLTENKCVVINYGGEKHRIALLEDNAGTLNSRNLHTGAYETYSNNKNGIFVACRNNLIQIDKDGKFSEIQRLNEDIGLIASSYDMSEVWQGKMRKGIKSGKPGSSSGDWSVTRDFILPNSPSPFVMPEMVNHPTRGVLVPTYGYDYVFRNYPQSQPLLLSGYNDGWWTNYSPVYANDGNRMVMTSTNGVAVDPDNPDYVYVSSAYSGFARMSLTDSEDLIHLSKPADKDYGNPGFIEFVENQVGENAWSCNFSTPRFDSYGNMWMVYADMDHQTPPKAHLYCWEASDRKATVSASNISFPKKLEVPGPTFTNVSFILPLRKSSNRDIILLSPRNYDGEMVLIDTNGTPADGSDDEVSIIKQFVDQDGNSVNIINPSYYWEDNITGYIWVVHQSGVVYFNPRDFLDGKRGNVYRIKVARNDGTNLADYLLEGVVVNNMTTDGGGRKWFGTTGGGIVVTSSDGRTIEQEINTDNSPIPSDNVYGMMYIPTTNSMLIATSEGIAEYYLSADATGDGDGDLKIYPNPVRPDYFGYVTIEGLPERSLVKIVDASGNIVKELGPASGDVQWNVTNHQFKRVSSGVYFVLASAGENESSFSTVGKILVIN